jgi:cytochrome c-type biogenesis protein CcsB
MRIGIVVNSADLEPVMPALFTLAVIAYVCATGLALAHLIQREEFVYRIASVVTLAGWVLHALALVKAGVETGRPPLGSIAEAVSVAVWVAVGLMMWVEREYGLKVLGAFVLPVVLMLSVSIARPLGLGPMNRALSSAWLWVHIALALVGIAAFVLNFAGALMYLLQERQLKGKRPGAVYYRLPSLATLDRLTYRTLAFGFPFLTTAIILGSLWASTAWGSAFALDPLVMLSFLAWAIYAATLAGRAAAGWHGRRAAYFSIVGFLALVLTLGAGLFLPGRHGS